MAPPAHVIVYPVPAEMSPERPRHGHAPRGSRTFVEPARRTDALSGDELSGLRPYAPGDRLTRLHWPSLARSGELVVREFVEPQAGSLSLLVDLRPSAHTGDSIEKTISRCRGARPERPGAWPHRRAVHEHGRPHGDRSQRGPGVRRCCGPWLFSVPPARRPRSCAGGATGRPGGAVWATGSVQGADVVLVTTPTGAAQAHPARVALSPGRHGARAMTARDTRPAAPLAPPTSPVRPSGGARHLAPGGVAGRRAGHGAPDTSSGRRPRGRPHHRHGRGGPPGERRWRGGCASRWGSSWQRECYPWSSPRSGVSCLSATPRTASPHPRRGGRSSRGSTRPAPSSARIPHRCRPHPRSCCASPPGRGLVAVLARSIWAWQEGPTATGGAAGAGSDVRIVLLHRPAELAGRPGPRAPSAYLRVRPRPS